ncbi:uncharacterized protein P174DRAFT_510972 [Aspergillus novofumigatus IBT 16806]|uniref:Uncharacterized protein n=1 Tax=Aspergillus novofumigatus (strain IBT 16806) TaxID=1392255 RepID=A0A2I1CC17_ASPN1|nr:uncharacterized protein P174DRAFT_510972 [Aspergillus novofumigatus IBT 16806]PKX95141.1 hypothetical protein P174DRAFT_510972 [Aspergillus novofumigatus IBT 16806]
MPQEPVAKFICVINLNEHDNKEIKRALHPEACFPPDIRTYKGFLEFYARNRPGRIKEKPTPETIEHFRRDFETALARTRDFCVPKSMSTTIKEYIISDLKTKVGLPDAEMSRDGLSPNDLTILQTQLWSLMLLYCFSSARTREKDSCNDKDANLQASAMAACYKHFILTIKLVDGILMLRMKKWEPLVHAFYKVIHFQEDLLDTPVFRPLSKLNCETSTGRARGADAFGKEFAALGYRNKKYSQTARMKCASHRETQTFGRSYAHPVCEVDGPATYLNIASHHEHIQNQHSMGMHRNPNLWQSLPAKAEFEFQEREDAIALNTEFEFLSKSAIPM